jgi:hypothetical protein
MLPIRAAPAGNRRSRPSIRIRLPRIRLPIRGGSRDWRIACHVFLNRHSSIVRPLPDWETANLPGRLKGNRLQIRLSNRRCKAVWEPLAGYKQDFRQSLSSSPPSPCLARFSTLFGDCEISRMWGITVEVCSAA